MTAISRSKVTIYIAPVGTALSGLVPTSTYAMKGDIKSYSKSGGEKAVESDPVFGGFVKKEKPITDVEISMDIIPAMGSTSNRYDALAYTKQIVSAKTVYTMSTEGTASTSYVLPVDQMVILEALDGTDYKTVAFNNATVTMIDMDHNADDNRTYKMSLKFSPTTATGVTNFMTGQLAASNLPDWTAL